MILYLAGGESHFNRLTGAGAKHILFSAHYLLQKKDIPNIAEHFGFKNVSDLKVMMDSGAFTFNLNPKDYSLKDVTRYRDKYVEWLKRNAKHIDLAVELDLSEHLSPEQQEEWRENYFKPLTKDYGLNICYVWHPSDKKSGWNTMCEKYDFVGLSQAGAWDTAKLASYCKIARKLKAKVHAFGFTKPDKLIHMKCYSADSSSWVNAMKYGTTFILDKNKFSIYDLNKKDIRNRYKRKYIKQGLDWNLIKRDDSNETTRASIMEWVLLETWINKRIKLIREKAAISKPDTVEKPKILTPAKPKENEDSVPFVPVSLLSLPGAAQLVCTTCHIGEECQLYDEKRTQCGYPLAAFPADLSSSDPLINAQIMILKTDWEVWQRNIQFQQQQGGYVDRSIMAQQDSLFSKISQLREATRPRHPGPGEMPSASPVITNNSAAAIQASPLAKLLGGVVELLQHEQKPELKTIDHIEMQPVDAIPTPLETAQRDKELRKEHKSAS